VVHGQERHGQCWARCAFLGGSIRHCFYSGTETSAAPEFYLPVTKHVCMNKAIFLDRDGVINRERGFTFRLEDFEILPGLIDSLKEFRRRGFLIIVVSNQSGIAKGLYTQADVEILHLFLNETLEKEQLAFDEIYYCMHHPDISRCICRKPDSLFIEKALARFNISPALSYFIGDKKRDVEAAQKAGVMGILIEPNTPLTELMYLLK
jgi:D-glycero-D-manno-heptose 1,7-bisphosphate phosphatase